MSGLMTITFDPSPISVKAMRQAIELVTGRKAVSVAEHDADDGAEMQPAAEADSPLRCASCLRPVELDLTYALGWAQPGEPRCPARHAGSGDNQCERRADHEEDGTAWSHVHAFRYGPADAFRVFRWCSLHTLDESRFGRMAASILMTPRWDGRR